VIVVAIDLLLAKWRPATPASPHGAVAGSEPISLCRPTTSRSAGASPNPEAVP